MNNTGKAITQSKKHNKPNQFNATMNITELKAAIEAAQSKAMEFKDADDGGTCNFDTPVIKLPEGIKPKKDLEGYLDQYGRPMLEKACGRMWKGWYFVNIDLYGQGNRRTAMAEAAAKSLEASGLQAGVYYQMD